MSIMVTMSNDIYIYEILKLSDTNHPAFTSAAIPHVDPVATTRRAALVEDPDSVFKLLVLRQLYYEKGLVMTPRS